jgi:Zn-dependent peptidase ImmA (M78 family)
LALLEEQGLQRNLPVPVEVVATKLGVLIRKQHFDADDVSGLLLREPGEAPIIGVNAGNAEVRQRFTVAHELGHLILHKGKRLVLDRAVRVNFRDAASSLATDREEMEANAFAAGLLMPTDALRDELHRIVQGRYRSDTALVDALAKRCHVSRSAMEFRLINLGMFTPGE